MNKETIITLLSGVVFMNLKLKYIKTITQVMEMRVEGRMRRGRPTNKWEYTIERNNQKTRKTTAEMKSFVNLKLKYIKIITQVIEMRVEERMRRGRQTIKRQRQRWNEFEEIERNGWRGEFHILQQKISMIAFSSTINNSGAIWMWNMVSYIKGRMQAKGI